MTEHCHREHAPLRLRCGRSGGVLSSSGEKLMVYLTKKQIRTVRRHTENGIVFNMTVSKHYIHTIFVMGPHELSCHQASAPMMAITTSNSTRVKP